MRRVSVHHGDPVLANCPSKVKCYDHVQLGSRTALDHLEPRRARTFGEGFAPPRRNHRYESAVCELAREPQRLPLAAARRAVASPTPHGAFRWQS